MYARSTTLRGRPESVDAGITHFRDDILPTLQDIEGFVGASLIVDRETGLCIITSSWASTEARQASAEQVRPLRDRAAGVFGAESTQVDEWEIGVMHRDHTVPEGACARATWTRVAPADMDRAIDVWKLAVLPGAEALDGFCSASLMIDRASGRSVGTMTYDSRAALEATRPQAESMRAEASKEARAEVLDVHEFDVALAHLHVPEMA